MGPEFGTEEYKKQVETIKTELRAAKGLGETVFISIISSYIFNKSYSRAAICQAEKEIRMEKHAC